MPTAKPARWARQYWRARSDVQSVRLADFSETSIEPSAPRASTARSVPCQAREVAMKIAAKHPDMAGIGIMLEEAVGLGLATPPGLSGFAGSRPSPSPVVRLFSCTVPKAQVQVRILLDDAAVACDELHGEVLDSAAIRVRPRPCTTAEKLAAVPLVPWPGAAAATRATRPTSVSSRANRSTCPISAQRSPKTWCARALPTSSQAHPREASSVSCCPAAKPSTSCCTMCSAAAVWPVYATTHRARAMRNCCCPVSFQSRQHWRRPSRSLRHDGF